MKLDLTIKERLVMLTIFPQKSDKMTLLICEDIERKVDFTDEERNKYGIKPLPSGWTWNEKYNETVFPIELSESELTVLKEQSKRLDREKQITKDMLSLIKKIDAA